MGKKSHLNKSELMTSCSHRKIVCLSKVYNHAGMHFKCKECGHTWKARPEDIATRDPLTDLITHKGGCPECAINRKRLGIEVAREEGIARGWTLLSDVYKNIKSPLYWQDNKTGHSWESCLENVQNRKESARCGCPECTKSYDNLFSEIIYSINAHKDSLEISRKFKLKRSYTCDFTIDNIFAFKADAVYHIDILKTVPVTVVDPSSLKLFIVNVKFAEDHSAPLSESLISRAKKLIKQRGDIKSRALTDSISCVLFVGLAESTGNNVIDHWFHDRDEEDFEFGSRRRKRTYSCSFIFYGGLQVYADIIISDTIISSRELRSDMPDDEEPEDDDSFYSTTVLPDRCKLKITKWSFPPQLSHISAKSITPNVVSAIGEYIQEKKAFKELFHPYSDGYSE